MARYGKNQTDLLLVLSLSMGGTASVPSHLSLMREKEWDGTEAVPIINLNTEIWKSSSFSWSCSPTTCGLSFPRRLSNLWLALRNFAQEIWLKYFRARFSAD